MSQQYLIPSWLFSKSSWFPLYLGILLVIVTKSIYAQEPNLALSPPRKITVVSDPWCPQVCGVNDPQKGYMVDIAKRAFELSSTPIEIKYENLAWSRAILEVRQGSKNAIIGAAISDAPDFVFPRSSIGFISYGFFTDAQSKWKFENLSSLEKIKFGVIRDYAYDSAIQDLISKKNPSAIVVSGENPLQQLIKMLKAKRIDALYEGIPVFKYATKNSPEFVYAGAPDQETQKLFIGFSPHNKDSKLLASAFDEGVKALRASGEYQRILGEYGISEAKAEGPTHTKQQK